MGFDISDFLLYLNRLFGSLKLSFYEGAFSLFCIGTIILIIIKGFKKGVRYSYILALIEYVVLIFLSTVFCRTTRAVREYDWHPLWSYQVVENGWSELLAQNLMNVLVFVPIGILMGLAFNNTKWWIVLLVGLILSVGIEATQYVFMKGFSEVDDVIHNTFGAVIGYGFFKGVRLLKSIHIRG